MDWEQRMRVQARLEPGHWWSVTLNCMFWVGKINISDVWLGYVQGNKEEAIRECHVRWPWAIGRLNLEEMYEIYVRPFTKVMVKRKGRIFWRERAPANTK